MNSEIKRKYSAKLHLFIPLCGIKEARLEFQTPTNLFLSRALLLVEVQDAIGIIKSEVKFPFLGYFKLKYISNRSLNLENIEMKINYKLLQSKEESMKLIVKVVRSSNKLKEIDCTYESQIISTQFSKYDTQIKFYQRLIPLKSRKTELTIGWNKDYSDRIRYLYNYNLNVSDLQPLKIANESYRIIIEATPFNINYELESDIELILDNRELQKLNIEIIGKDVNGRENMDFRGFLNYERNYLFLNQTVNAALKYAGHDLFYHGHLIKPKDLNLAGILEFQQQHKRNITVVHNER
jgi:hypothetical protein